MADSIISALSTSPLPRVASRTSSFAERGADDVVSTARRLGVDYLIEGSFRQTGTRFLVNAQLVWGDDGSTMWTRTLEVEGTDTQASVSKHRRMIAAAR